MSLLTIVGANQTLYIDRRTDALPLEPGETYYYRIQDDWGQW